MVSKIIVVSLFHIFLSSQLLPSKAQTWIRAGYWDISSLDFPMSAINSSFFTHVVCYSAYVSNTSYQLYLSPSDEERVSSFTKTVRKSNPSVTILLSIGGKNEDVSIFSSMANNPSYRKSFIDSSIKIARLYGFQGLELDWEYPENSSDMYNMGVLFEDWRATIYLEARNSSLPQLILTAAVDYSPSRDSRTYPIEKIRLYLDWVHALAVYYTTPNQENVTGAHAALYNPTGFYNTEYGIKKWIDGGLPANKLVLCLPYFGYAWTLKNPVENGIGAPAKGPSITQTGFLTYQEIKILIMQYPDVHVIYNSTYVVNYCTIETTWIGFDDVEAVRVKTSYAKDKRLLGYIVWEVIYDFNLVLSQAAAEVDTVNNNSSDQADNKTGNSKRRLLVIVLITAAAIILLLGIFVVYCCWRRKLKFKGTVDSAKQSNYEVTKAPVAGEFNGHDPNLIIYTLADIEVATDRFSFLNKLGEGGFGPVYKGILSDGQEIAVKKLSKTSTQGYEEFRNEVVLTAKLQHVNLVRLLGYCIDKEEQMLIYEYLPNKSLDSYLFDPMRKYILRWEERVHIINGIIQGLLYLQEFSRLTIIHRDLKVSNVLLDRDLNAKISDFGMARIFFKDDLEANTSRIVGTRGYISPEYVQRGMYSTKSDIYSFGVLLLQIISGKRISFLYRVNEGSSLLDYAYELWKDGKGMEFMDASLDDTNSSCTLMRCLQIALLCVQENPNDRPSILEVFSMLRNETMDTMIPKKPAFWKQNVENGRNISALHLESSYVGSKYDVTVSEVGAR